MVLSSIQSVSPRSLGYFLAVALILGFMALPASAAPCCSSCDIEDPDDYCWYWCVFSCYGDSSEQPVVGSSLVDDQVPACVVVDANSSKSAAEAVVPQEVEVDQTESAAS